MEPPPAVEDAFISSLSRKLGSYRAPITNDISQANERSFLAWLKLSVSFFGLGIGLLGQRSSLKNAIPASAAALCASVAFLVFATWRYFKARSVLVSGFDDPMAESVNIFLTVVIICIISFAIFTFVPEFAD